MINTNGTICLILCASLAALCSFRAAAFEPFPGNQRELFKYDLKKTFYATDADHKADIEKARGILTAVEKHRGKVGSSAKELLELYNLISEYTDIYYRLYAYGEFREAVNTKDREPYEAYLELASEGDSRTAFVKVELKELSLEKYEAFLKEEPGLARFDFLLRDTLRKSGHFLSREKEEVLSRLAPTRYEWPGVLFQLAFDRTSFDQVEAGGKTWDSQRDFEALLRNPDRAAREKAFRGYYKGLASVADICGFSLHRLMKAYNEETAMRGFPTYYDETLFDSYLTREEVSNIFGQLERSAGVYKEYQAYRLENAKKREKLASPEMWDVELPPADAEEPMFTAMEAVETIKKALEPLGPAYGAELSRLLDPRNGRLDIVGGPNRRQGAFCEAGFGFFQDNYQGFLTDASTIAHEAGHAIHHRLVLVKKNGEIFSQGPPYMTESFSMFNEYLFKDHLLSTLKDEKQKRSLIYDRLNEEMYLWELARRARFEMEAYDGVASGRIRDEEGFNAVCLEVGKKYDIFFDRYPEMKHQWIRKHHYWTVPTYYKNYVVAQILAMKYFELYKKDPQGFAKRYVAMVEAGMEKEPRVLLKEYLGIDLSDPDLLGGSLKLVREHFDSARNTGNK